MADDDERDAEGFLETLAVIANGLEHVRVACALIVLLLTAIAALLTVLIIQGM